MDPLDPSSLFDRSGADSSPTSINFNRSAIVSLSSSRDGISQRRTGERERERCGGTIGLRLKLIDFGEIGS